MKLRLLFLAGLLFPPFAAAQDHIYPAHSWTYNVDFKDMDALSPFVGRELVDGQWKGGLSWAPLSVYYVNDAAGAARRWFTSGVFLVSNAEKRNATFGPTIGVDVFFWTSQIQAGGPVQTAATSIWKPFRLASVTASVNAWGGWTPIHTSDVHHNYAGGFGFALKGKFGGGAKIDVAEQIIKAGL